MMTSEVGGDRAGRRHKQDFPVQYYFLCVCVCVCVRHWVCRAHQANGYLEGVSYKAAPPSAAAANASAAAGPDSAAAGPRLRQEFRFVVVVGQQQQQQQF